MALKTGAVSCLLDVKALIALVRERHTNHEITVTWFERNAQASRDVC